jgi:ceramide glucosyltransferase
VLSGIAEIATLAAIAYVGVAIARTAHFGKRGKERSGHTPPVTVLVPLRGVEPGLEENLCSIVDQEYPTHQVVFGVARADDPALTIARRVAAAHPARHIEIDIGECAVTRNPKLANVVSMMRLARHEVLVLCDSDTRVDSSYLREVVAPLEDASIGLVTCLFAGVPQDDTLASKLIAMFMNDQFIPSALVEGVFGPLQHGFGPTNAMRADVLKAIGGFEALGEHLADDFMLGNEIAARGLKVVISKYVLRTTVSEPNLAALFRHELRWHRTIRGVEPAGYAGMFITYPIPLAFLAFLLARNRRRAGLLVLVAALGRIALQRVSARALGVKPAGAWLVLPRDFFGLAVWASGLVGTSVRWRDADLSIDSGDVLLPAEAVPEPEPSAA